MNKDFVQEIEIRLDVKGSLVKRYAFDHEYRYIKHKAVLVFSIPKTFMVKSQVQLRSLLSNFLEFPEEN